MKTLSKLDPIIENVVTKRLRKTLDICAKRNMLTLIFGETGRGKSLTAAHWCAKRPNARHIMLDAATSQAMLVRRIARELLGECRGSTEENKNAIERYLLDNETILVIDEANQLLEPPSLSAKKKNMEYLRLNLWEKTHTPVALIFTTYSLGEFSHGRLSAFLEQFLGRAMNRCDIPAGVFYVSEVTPIVRSIFPNAAPEMIAAAVEIAGGTGKLRSLVAYLNIMRELVADDSSMTPDAALLLDIRDNYEKGGEWPRE